MKKRIFAFLLASLLLLSSCSEKAADESDQDLNTPDTSSPVTAETDPAAEETPAETDDPRLQYNPGFEQEDHEGRNFTFIYADNDFEPNLDVCAEEITGEALNDAVYNRNLAVNEKFGITIDWLRDGNSFKLVEQSIKAKDMAYDVYTDNGVNAFNAALKGYTQVLNDYPNIDFSKPYWNSNMLAGSSVNFKNYFAYSDMNIHALGATPCTLFNKKVAEQFQIPDLYETVINGQWTFDKMGEYITLVTADLDNNGIIEESDRHGFIGNTFVIDCFLSGTGYQTITKDDKDIPALNIETEEYFTIIEAIQKICSVETGSFICDRYPGVDREYAPMEALAEDRALFWIANLKGVERMREMESEFGLLPIPKLNEAQQDYKIHYQANIGGAMSVPITVRDDDLIGKVLEEMAYQSMLTVKPTYVNVLLEGKFLRDEESLVTMEIMFDSYYSDLGFMTTSSGIAVLTNLRNIVQNNTAIASSIKASTKIYAKSLDKLNQSFLEDAAQ